MHADAFDRLLLITRFKKHIIKTLFIFDSSDPDFRRQHS